MAIRMIRGYRTIAGESANLLAGLLPWDLEATALQRVYEWRVEAHRRGVTPLPREVEARREELRRDLRAVWRGRLSRLMAWHAAIAAVRPLFEEWLEKRHGVLTFRLTQVLTGHGCFGRYLCLKLGIHYVRERKCEMEMRVSSPSERLRERGALEVRERNGYPA